MLLQPPWNIAIFFLLYALCFMLLVQDTFTVSVVGQVCMGTLFVRADPLLPSPPYSLSVSLALDARMPPMSEGTLRLATALELRLDTT